MEAHILIFVGFVLKSLTPLPDATYRAASQIAQFVWAKLNNLRLIQVDAFGAALNPLLNPRGWLV